MLDQKTNAVLLLCSHFSNQKNEQARPLTPTEYGRFAKWLHEQGHSPEDLLHDFDSLVDHWMDPKGKITRERIKELLDRSMALALALEKWQRIGIWVMTRSDPEYPWRLKKRLEYNSPALFYGVGDKRLLNAGGLAIVGSRGIDEDEKKYTHTMARQAALEGLNVVSGGAKGVDETAMLGALSVEGTASGVLAEGLLKAAVSSKWRNHLMNKQLVLVSPFSPEARFQVGNAMARNKYIYCLADYGLVVRSDEGSGGTWSGATENLKKGWVPLYVKPDSDAPGNRALIAQGGEALATDINECGKAGVEPLRAALGLNQDEDEKEPPDNAVTNESALQPSKQEEALDTQSIESEIGEIADTSNNNVEGEDLPQINSMAIDVGADAFYFLFRQILESKLRGGSEVKLDDFKKDYPDIMPKQLTVWFDRAEEDGLIERMGKRRIYILKSDSPQLDI